MRTTNAAMVETFELDGFEICVYHVDDEDPDLSWLGDYFEKQPEYPFYDRALRRIIHDGAEYDAFLDDAEMQERAEDWRRGDYRYIGGFQKAADDRETWDKAILADVERLRGYNEGEWACIGVVAEAWRDGVKLGSATVWGVESASEASYLHEVALEQAREAVHEAKEKLGKLQAKERWTEQQERLLRAAQDVVNDAEGPNTTRDKGEFYVVYSDTLDVLKAIVQEISDGAVKAIEAIQAEARLGHGCTCGEAYGSRPQETPKCAYCVGAMR